MKLRYAFRTLARDGEARCGDAVMARLMGDRALFAVIDALGHGDEAAQVAERALQALSLLPFDIGALSVVETLQQALRGTRGAAVTVCTLRELQAEFCGVGNVTCRTIGAAMPFVPKPGIVGGPRKHLVTARLTLNYGQRLVLHSDGISHRFDLRVLSSMTPEEACDFIFSHQRYAHDDASVLVIDAGSIRETAS